MDKNSDSESSSAPSGSDDGSDTTTSNNIDDFDDSCNNWKDETDPRMTSLGHLNEAARVGREFVDKYASIDPPRDDDDENDPKHATNPYRNVPAIALEMEQTRKGLEDAWKNAKAVFDKEHQKLRQQQQKDNVQIIDDKDLNFRDDDDENDDENDHLLPAVGLEYNIDWSAPIDLDMEVNLDDVRGTFGDEIENSAADDNNDEQSMNASSNDENSSDENDDEEEKDNDHNDLLSPEDFRAIYMDMMTDAFGDDLEQIHTEEGERGPNNSNIDVDILAECLETGINFLEPHEKDRKSFFRSLGWTVDDDENDDMRAASDEGPTIHELRQRELGYILPPNEDKKDGDDG